MPSTLRVPRIQNHLHKQKIKTDTLRHPFLFLAGAEGLDRKCFAFSLRSATEILTNFSTRLALFAKNSPPDCFLTLRTSRVQVLQACFDNISHEWVLKHIPLDKKVLYQFLKSGYLEELLYHSTDKGIPQGGSISSVICNMVLDGIECRLINKFGKDVHMVRYADDIIIVADSFSFLVQSIVPELNSFLNDRGLRLSSKKTKVVHISNGFDFLGCRIYRRQNQIISVPLRKNVDSLIDKINKELTVISDRELDDLSYDEAATLGNALKQYIRGWINYYDNIVTVQSLIQVKEKVLCQAIELTGDNRIAGFIKKLF